MGESIGEKLGRVVGQLEMVVDLIHGLDPKISALEKRAERGSAEFRNMQEALKSMSQHLEEANRSRGARWWDILKLLIAAGVGAAVSLMVK